LEQIEELTSIENTLKQHTIDGLSADEWRFLKQKGFSDRRLAKLLKVDAASVRAARHRLKVFPVYKRVDTCAAEFSTNTAYLYSTYEAEHGECESQPTNRDKIMVLGGGPNRIGQGITAVCTLLLPCAKTVTKPLWSTATPRPYRPTTTHRIACILSP
jgi:carbamoyl-phosphate synthase large subunit